jgi:hypothetical protein
MSILLYDYKELTQCVSEVERIEGIVNSKKKDWSTKKEDKTGRKGRRRNAYYVGWLFS